MLSVGIYEGTGLIRKIEIRSINDCSVNCLYYFRDIGCREYRRLSTSVVMYDIRHHKLKISFLEWD